MEEMFMAWLVACLVYALHPTIDRCVLQAARVRVSSANE